MALCSWSIWRKERERQETNGVRQIRTWSKTFAQDLTNQKGEDAWPITSTTFILIHKDQKKPEQGTEVLKFFDWAYKTGAKQANDLDYASLPDSVVEQVRAAWKTNIKDSSGKPLY